MRGFGVRGFGIMAAMLAAWAWGCGCGANPSPGAGSPSPTDPRRPLAASVTTSEAGVPLASTLASDDGDPARMQPVLEDARLGAIAKAAAGGDPRGAAQAMQAAIDQHHPAGQQLGRWRYVQGELLVKAGDATGAAQAFDACAATGWVASAHAKLAAARAWASAGKHAEAIERAGSVPADLPIHASARLVHADSLDATGDTAGAVALWKAHLASKKRAPRWAELSVRVAEFLLRGSPSAAQVREAYDLVRAVTIDAPASGSAANARELLARAIAASPAEHRAELEKLSIEERLAQAQALGDSGRREEAAKTCARLVEELAKQPKPGKALCDAAVCSAQAWTKANKRPLAADAWSEAVQRCEPHKDQLLVALFQGAKAHASAGRAPDASRLYGRVEAEFHGHSYADDARLRGARVALMMKDEGRFAQMLGKIGDDYPEGDMLEDGMFELALHQIDKGEHKAALATLERSISLRPMEKPYWVAGRARYFAARVQGWLGRKDDEARGLREVITQHPFSYYMMLAWSRLAASDPKAAHEALTTALGHDDPTPFIAPPGPELQRPAFHRALELLRVGEHTLAREEILSLGLSSEANGPALWTIASLYARAGASDLAFKVARSRTGEWSGRFPSGKWRTPWELAYPRAFQSIMDRETARSGIPTALGYGIMREESLFEADAVSGAPAYGLMQLIVPTGKAMGAPLGIQVDGEALKRPEVNIPLGCRYLGQLRAGYPAAPVLAIPSYNAGPGATKRWLDGKGAVDFDVWTEQIPYDETRNYTKRVISTMSIYSWLYEREAFEKNARLPLQVRL